jgi:hypothetical protein
MPIDTDRHTRTIADAHADAYALPPNGHGYGNNDRRPEPDGDRGDSDSSGGTNGNGSGKSERDEHHELGALSIPVFWAGFAHFLGYGLAFTLAFGWGTIAFFVANTICLAVCCFVTASIVDALTDEHNNWRH